jgi:CheY-like chemotaxis protein
VTRILVIDDEEAARGLIRAILEPMGYSILEAVDGRDGINRFRQSPTDLVVTAMYMPRGDGLIVIRELQADYPT